MLTSNRQSEMIGQKVLVRQSVKVMKGDKVLSETILFEKPKEVPTPTAPAPIQKPKTPPTSPKATRPEFLEPMVISPTVSEGIKKQWREEMRQSEQQYYGWEANLPATWEREIERLERERERFNKKPNWSASDLAKVERIDKELESCIQILNRFYDYETTDYESE